jgi:cold shock CspA family protein
LNFCDKIEICAVADVPAAQHRARRGSWDPRRPGTKREDDDVRLTGTIKRWVDKGGYGFIQRGPGTDDVFVHVSACRCHPYQGLSVSFELGSRNGKVCAQNVVALDGPQSAPELNAIDSDDGLTRTLKA